MSIVTMRADSLPGLERAAGATVVPDDQASLDARATADILFSPDGWLLACDAGAARLLRLPEDYDARGLNIRQFCRTPEHFIEAAHAVQVTGRLDNWDGDFVALDGTPAQVLVDLVGSFDDTRELVAIHARLFPVTDWGRAEQWAEWDRQRHAIGRMTGGVAHDFNNLLTVINGHVECLAELMPEGDPLRRSVAALHKAAERAAALSQNLLAFSRQQIRRPRPIDPGVLLQSVGADLRRTFGRRIVVGVELAAPLGGVRIDPPPVARALGALAAHAVAAMPDGGAVTLRAQNASIGLDAAHARPFVKPNFYLRIDLACAGMRVDPEVRMFEPLFTESGSLREGTGLADVFATITQSGGYVWLDTGRTLQPAFTVLLPAEAAVAPPSALQDPVASGTVLVIDDDDEVRGLVVSILQHQGYTVLDSGSADGGAALCAAHDVDLLICDVVLNGVRGDVFAASLLESHPRLKVMCVSGYPEARAVRDLAPERAAFLRKPFSGRALVERVGELLAVEE